MNADIFNRDLLAFLQASPTPFHAVRCLSERLDKAGFRPLKEGDAWKIQPGGRYYVCRNDSSMIAFIQGQKPLAESGIRMVGAHTDSPCLKVKPQPEIYRQGYYQIGVEVYGGALLNPWYDRDLSLAGRVSFLDENDLLQNALINYSHPIAVIPSLAIHLDREANNSRSINPEKDILPIIMQVKADEGLSFRELLLEQVKKDTEGCKPKSVLDYELSFYDTQAPALVGLKQEFIASARLDNLLSCYVGLRSLLSADKAGSPALESSLLICNDHEEVGSVSTGGAQGTMLTAFLERLIPGVECRNRAIDASMMISADNAHGIHPNYSDKHDSHHGPLLNHGPVIKINANQSYATNSETAAVFRHLCKLSEVPVQTFVSRADMRCGSTIGPITAAGVGVKTLDVGMPTFAMHSIREIGGTQDAFSLFQVLERFYRLSTLGVRR